MPGGQRPVGQLQEGQVQKRQMPEEIRPDEGRREARWRLDPLGSISRLISDNFNRGYTINLQQNETSLLLNRQSGWADFHLNFVVVNTSKGITFIPSRNRKNRNRNKGNLCQGCKGPNSGGAIDLFESYNASKAVVDRSPPALINSSELCGATIVDRLHTDLIDFSVLHSEECKKRPIDSHVPNC